LQWEDYDQNHRKRIPEESGKESEESGNARAVFAFSVELGGRRHWGLTRWYRDSDFEGLAGLVRAT
jgi:hypothetical protein